MVELSEKNIKIYLRLFHNYLCELMSPDFNSEFFNTLADKNDFMTKRLNDLFRDIYQKNICIKSCNMGFDTYILLSNNHQIQIVKITPTELMMEWHTNDKTYIVYYYDNIYQLSTHQPLCNYYIDVKNKDKNKR